ncbi:unnamed protein product [Rhodiola kirilowii]
MAAITELLTSGSFQGSYCYFVWKPLFEIDVHYVPIKPIRQGTYDAICLNQNKRTSDSEKVVVTMILSMFEKGLKALKALKELKFLRHVRLGDLIPQKDVMLPTHMVGFKDFYLVYDISHVMIIRTWAKPFKKLGGHATKGQLQIKFIMFVPRRAPFGIFDIHKKMNIIELYVSRFFVMDNCERLTPKCSGFIKAVENSDHLFLSILRHILSMSKMECQNDTYSMTNESKEAAGKSQRLEKLNKNGDAVLIMLDMRYEYEYGIGRFGTTFHSAGFGTLVVRYINNFFMFSLPRPPKIASLWLPLSF